MATSYRAEHDLHGRGQFLFIRSFFDTELASLSLLIEKLNINVLNKAEFVKNDMVHRKFKSYTLFESD